MGAAIPHLKRINVVDEHELFEEQIREYQPRLWEDDNK